jgi:hypothetical protein
MTVVKGRICALMIAIPSAGACALAQLSDEMRLNVPVPQHAAPILVLEGVEAPVYEGIRIEVLGPGGDAATSDSILGVAGLMGSRDAQTGASTTPMTLVIPLNARVNEALAHESVLPLHLRVRTVRPTPVPAKIRIQRAYLRTVE